MASVVVVTFLSLGAQALAPTTKSSSRVVKSTKSFNPFEPVESSGLQAFSSSESWFRSRANAICAVTFLAAVPESAIAKGGEYGIAEGRIISLLHPAMMFACFGTSIYAGYTGWQWRRLREIGTELSAAKKDAKAKIAAYEAAAFEGVAPLSVSSAKVEAQELVETLTAESVSLKNANSREVHYILGTVLLAIGIPFAIEGPVNTYMRAGKLFPGPHVYAGAACASLWAMAAALVPYMQKGKGWARSAHVALNAINVALFAYYQIPTGLEITKKVIQNTKFP